MNQQKIAITGGSGFLGQQIIKQLTNIGYHNNGYVNHSMPINPGTVSSVRSKIFNLTTEVDVSDFYSILKPTVVIHAAAAVGGIGANQKNPGLFYYKNIIMGTLLMEYARQNKVTKFVNIGTVCSYPKYSPVPFKEDDLWNGYPEETNAPYGIAKRGLIIQSIAYRKQYNFNSINLIPVNMYGPGDNFDPESSHVIPAIIKKCIDAKESNAKQIECWGTGSASREFIHVTDAAEAIVKALFCYNESDPINIGTGNEITIKELTEKIAKLCGYTGLITWNKDRPDGQPRRCLDISKAKEKLNFTPKIGLDEGLASTIEWYQKQREMFQI